MQKPNITAIKKDELQTFKNELIKEMKAGGATSEDFIMFEDESLFNDIVATAIANKKSPKDVAWALLQ